MPPASRSLFARVFTFSALLTGLFAFFLCFLCFGRPVLADPDIWWHLHNAQQLFESHAFIQTDSYTWSVAGRPWINPEWISEVPYYFAWKNFGNRGLELVAVAFIEALVLAVGALAYQRTRDARASLLACIVFLPFLSVSLGPRTLLVGWLCFIAELALLADFRTAVNPARLWLLPPLFAFWINAHGSWPIGIVFLTVFLVSGLFSAGWGAIELPRWTSVQRNRLILVLALSVAALFLNPYGARLVAYPFHITFAHKLTTSTVEEWQTLDFHAVRGKLTFLILATVLAANMLRRRAWPLHQLLFTLIAVLAAFTYTRFLVLAGIVLCPILAQDLNFFGPTDTGKDKPVLNFAFLAVLAAVVATHVPTQAELQKQIDAANPAKAVGWLRTANPRGRIFNEFGWGGYLEWNLPETPFYIDPRADVFDEAGVLQDYIDATSIHRTLEVLGKDQVRYVLFPKKDPIVYLLNHTLGWTTRYQDDTAILLERDPIH